MRDTSTRGTKSVGDGGPRPSGHSDGFSQLPVAIIVDRESRVERDVTRESPLDEKKRNRDEGTWPTHGTALRRSRPDRWPGTTQGASETTDADAQRATETEAYQRRVLDDLQQRVVRPAEGDLTVGSTVPEPESDCPEVRRSYEEFSELSANLSWATTNIRTVVDETGASPRTSRRRARTSAPPQRR
jgi:hypothetical protein